MIIDILLATYNGGKYLRQQLDSLLAQTNSDWRLIVRDDGSVDDTLDITREYAAKIAARYGEGKMIILANPPLPEQQQSKKSHPIFGLRGLSVIHNFSALMEWSKADGRAGYAMFCDQDDIWHPGKIAKTLAVMTASQSPGGNAIPLLVHTDARSVYDDGALQYASVKAGWRHNISKTSFKTELLQNTTHGCTIMMNRALVDLAAPIPDQALMHDSWVALVAESLGRRLYLAEQTLDYRQHQANVSGGSHNKKFIVILKRVGAVLRQDIDQARALRVRLDGCAPSAQVKTLDRFLAICAYPPLLRGTLLFFAGYRCNPLRRNAILLF